MSSSDKQPSASDAGLKIWSCVICRRRKVRCDRRDPCSNCVKNNIECHFPVTGRIPRRNQNSGTYKSPAQKQSELLGRLRRLESVVTELAAQVEDGSQDSRAAVAPEPSGPVSISSSETGPTLADSEDPSVTESSLRASSTSQQGGSEYYEEFGRLVVDKDGGLHVGNRFWSVFCGEVDNILHAVHDVSEYSGPSGDSIMPDPGLEASQSPPSHMGFMFGNADFAKALDGLNPMPSQMLFIWQAYVENVDPFIKVLHVPTVEKVIRELRGNFSSYGASMEALLFSISLAAITSMDEEAVSFSFSIPKSQLIQRYRFGTEQALARADFLTTKDMIVLQALVIYLSLLPHLGSREKVWPMVGLVLRLAKSAGLHREDGGHAASQLEMETRRRLWWQICFVDSQSRKVEAPELSITPSSFDTSIPSNLDDIDLMERAPSHLPASHERPTTTTLCRIRCELWRLTQLLRDDATKSPESQLELLNLTKTKIETKYLRHLQLENPWDSFIKTMATLFFSKVELLIRRQPGLQHSVDTSLEPVMNTIKSVNALKSDPSWAKWRWQLQAPLLTEDNVPSQRGKVFIVTGGNSGVGFELCKMLYTTGATIYLTSRSEERAMNAIKQITSSEPAPANPGVLNFLHLDLNDLDSVRVSAAEMASQEAKLDVLWNNAGTGGYRVSPGAKTAQGLEAMVGMHCVATLLFTTLLLPQLRAAAARVVWTSSVVADQGSPPNGINFDTLSTGTSDRVLNYAVSKVGSWMLSRELARRYGSEGIISVAQNPGNVMGGSYEGTPAATMFFLNRFLLHPSRFGAYTELYAGLSPDITTGDNGAYIIPWGRVRPDTECPRRDIVHAMLTEEDGGLGYCERLWDWCEEQWQA
ncbi:hypothetical protein N0V84_005170 [Fusarium piperis]|uniref:Zn(2)-C6 fungal-type domain-containing protein n=1 Tax=Fusarium piperis TaxID=1435070 RepID=A0A9W8WE83_9HYPO|nr:hypothetical protein N0V84_005170 [Fusarium piperis]